MVWKRNKMILLNVVLGLAFSNASGTVRAQSPIALSHPAPSPIDKESLYQLGPLKP